MNTYIRIVRDDTDRYHIECHDWVSATQYRVYNIRIINVPKHLRGYIFNGHHFGTPNRTAIFRTEKHAQKVATALTILGSNEEGAH